MTDSKHHGSRRCKQGVYRSKHTGVGRLHVLRHLGVQVAAAVCLLLSLAACGSTYVGTPSATVAHLEPWLVRECFGPSSSSAWACEELALGFWDRQYLRRYGFFWLEDLLEMPPFPPDIGGGDPSPDPGPWVREVAALELDIEPAALRRAFRPPAGLDPTPTPMTPGDPSPQPSIMAVISNTELRIETLRSLRQRLQGALEGIEAELSALQERVELEGRRPE